MFSSAKFTIRLLNSLIVCNKQLVDLEKSFEMSIKYMKSSLKEEREYEF